MKRQLLLTVLAVSISTIAFGQQWVNFANGTNANRINFGDLDVTGDSITIEAIVSWHNASPNIISKHQSPSDCSYLLRTNGLELTTNTLGYKRLDNPVVLCVDTAYHVAGTYDGDSMKFYVNGVQVSSVAWSGNLVQNNYNGAIGNRAGNLNEQFLGFIDEVRIWNVARTQTEIANNMYNLPNPTTQTGLLAYYKFDGSYTNIQGNTMWDGIANGSQISLITNPYFNGVVSNIFCTPVGIVENVSESIFKVSPNPSDGHFTISLSDIPKENSTLVLKNVVGQKLIEFKLIDKTTLVNFNTPNGIYFATISTDTKIYTAKIIIER